jgi:hypothetical protein
MSMLRYLNSEGSIYEEEVSQEGALTEEELPVRTHLPQLKMIKWHSHHSHAEFNDRALEWSGEEAEDNPRVVKPPKRLFEQPVKDDTVHILSWTAWGPSQSGCE